MSRAIEVTITVRLSMDDPYRDLGAFDEVVQDRVLRFLSDGTLHTLNQCGGSGWIDEHYTFDMHCKTVRNVLAGGRRSVKDLDDEWEREHRDDKG